ncbi:hypothetical protein [Xanthomonas translucens]|uniref:hypothetical protein n=1 Tax=Xanthomonas campestris pv. translucens TaxID=343 RepID=UPI001F50B282|nr:hypothetical protein [Xanthomonas translucens]
MLGLSLGDMSRTTLFHPVPTDDELPSKRTPRLRHPAQSTVGSYCHDVLAELGFELASTSLMEQL